MKFNKILLAVTSIVILLPLAAGAVLWNSLPEQMAVHWGISQGADGWADRAFAVFVPPFLMLLVHWICIIISSRDKSNRDQNRKAMGMVLWICPIMSLFVNAVIYSTAYGMKLSPYTLTVGVLGILFLIIGNYMPKCKQNRTLGVKIPWTFNSEENWNRTHRLTGKVWVICGLIFIFSVFVPEKLFTYLLIAVILPAVIIPLVYSYLYYRKEVKNGSAQKVSYNKKSLIITLVVMAMLLCGLSVLLFSGNVTVSYGEKTLTVDSIYWRELTINYDDIDSIEYRDTCDKGQRVNGFGSPKLLLGSFKNDEFGSYIRYSYTSEDACIVINTDEGTVVIGAKNAEETKEMYNMLLKKFPG